MRAALTTLFILCFCVSSLCQIYRRVTFGAGLGKGFSGYYGPLLFLEPSYHLSDAWSIGARLEGGIGSYNRSLSLLGSYSLNGYYFISSQSFRPFVGIGAGFYAIETGTGSACDCTRDAARGLPGFYPSIGFSYNHLMVKVEYNIVAGGNVRVTGFYPGVPPATVPEFVKPDYLSMKVGVLIGGGRRKLKTGA
jgi:hypothetical protein